jgi:lipopolysaccharide transport protein LptA/LPS export ABC transporter protein LptC
MLRFLSAARALALATLILVAAALLVYIILRERSAGEGADVPKLQGRLTAVFNNTRYAHEVGGVIRFVLTAAVDRAYEDGSHELEQVRLEARGADGSRNDLITADRAKVSDPSNLENLKVEFISNVRAQTSEGLTIETDYLRYDQKGNLVETESLIKFRHRKFAGQSAGMCIEMAAERLLLKREVQITVGDQTKIAAASALFEKKERRIRLARAVLSRRLVEARADQMVGYLDQSNRIERVEANQNVRLREEGRAHIEAARMEFFFEGQKLARAVASEAVRARTLGPEPLKEAQADWAQIIISRDRRIESLTARGKAYFKMAGPTDRQIWADSMRLEFGADGQSLKSVEAIGNATCKVAGQGATVKTISAPQMSADFFKDSRIKSFNAGGGVRVTLEVASGERPPQIITGQRLQATFSADSQDIERLTVEGDVKYNEGDRNAMAEWASYLGQTESLELRGGRPTAWDSKARTQADQLDYDRRGGRLVARGDVRTTYYSREATDDSTPFKASKSPIFLTAQYAEIYDSERKAIYTGDARGWQEDNFIRADRIELYQQSKRMIASGQVQSALYSAKRKSSDGKVENVPAFAWADRMVYSDADRHIRYEGNVRARQGGDQIQAEIVDAYLKPDVNQLDRLTAEGKVIMIEPGRKASADKLSYNSEEDRIVLIGNMARVEDQEKGTITGAQLTFSSGGDRISAENRSGIGRVKSTHRLTKKRQAGSSLKD